MTVTSNIKKLALETVKPVVVFLQVLVRVAPLRPSAVYAVPGVGWWGIYVCSAAMSTRVCRKRNCLFPKWIPRLSHHLFTQNINLTGGPSRDLNVGELKVIIYAIIKIILRIRLHQITKRFNG